MLLPSPKAGVQWDVWLSFTPWRIKCAPRHLSPYLPSAERPQHGFPRSQCNSASSPSPSSHLLVGLVKCPSRSTWTGSRSWDRWDDPSEQHALGFIPGGGAVPAPKSRNRSQVTSVPQPEGKWESSCLPSSQFSLAASEEGLRPTIRAEWSCSPLLLRCKSWLCIFGGKMPVLPHGCLLPRSFPGGNPCNCASTCWDRKMLLITGSRGWH